MSGGLLTFEMWSNYLTAFLKSRKILNLGLRPQAAGNSPESSAMAVAVRVAVAVGASGHRLVFFVRMM